jgi:hypothetical protein
VWQAGMQWAWPFSNDALWGAGLVRREDYRSKFPHWVCAGAERLIGGSPFAETLAKGQVSGSFHPNAGSHRISKFVDAGR